MPVSKMTIRVLIFRYKYIEFCSGSCVSVPKMAIHVLVVR